MANTYKTKNVDNPKSSKQDQVKFIKKPQTTKINKVNKEMIKSDNMKGYIIKHMAIIIRKNKPMFANLVFNTAKRFNFNKAK